MQIESPSFSATLLYTAAATDADTGQTLTYGFTASSTVFAIDKNTGKVTLLSALDYETATSHQVLITVFFLQALLKLSLVFSVQKKSLIKQHKQGRCSNISLGALGKK